MVALCDLNSHGKLFVEEAERFELDQNSGRLFCRGVPVRMRQ